MPAYTLSLLVTIIVGQADVSLRIDGKTTLLDPPAVLAGAQAYVSPSAFAAAIGMTAKTVAPVRLIVLCTDVACVPVYLKPGDVRTIDGQRLVSLERIADSAGYALARDGSIFSLTAMTHPARDRAATFSEGSMLPDVVVTDLAGQPVHLSQYLGQRVLICTWASW